MHTWVWILNFYIITFALMCVRNQHSTCMPGILLYKLTCCWHIVFFLFVEKAEVTMVTIGNLYWCDCRQEQFWKVVNGFLKCLCKNLSGRFSTVSFCTVSFCFLPCGCIDFFKSWLGAVEYRINQLHKHGALILTNKQPSESISWQSCCRDPSIALRRRLRTDLC